MNIVSYSQFASVEIRAGTIVRAEPFKRARNPAYKVWVDFGGEFGVKQTSAQITQLYQPEDLVNMQVLGCINLGEKNIAGFQSEFLLLGFENDEGAIALATVEQSVPNGNKLQ